MACSVGALDSCLHATSAPGARVAHASSPAWNGGPYLDTHCDADTNPAYANADAYVHSHAYAKSRGSSHAHPGSHCMGDH